MPSLSPVKSVDTADRELIFTRLLDAPVGVVFEAWTNPTHLTNWWGPNGFTTTIKEMDVRPGGLLRLTMHGPDGQDYRNRIVFVEVDAPRRLVYRHEPEPGDEPVSHETTVSFEEDGGKTRLTMHMVFPSTANRDYVIETYHADEGATQTLGRLADHLHQMAEANKHVVITRIFDAPRALVFKAWTDPKHLAQWWGPHGFTNPVCEVDVRPGGRIVIHMRAPNGIEYKMHGSFTEIAEPNRLVFKSGVDDAESGAQFEILNTVTFVDKGPGKTELTLDIRVLSANCAARGSLAGAQIGWAQSLDRLAILLESDSRSHQ